MYSSFFVREINIEARVPRDPIISTLNQQMIEVSYAVLICRGGSSYLDFHSCYTLEAQDERIATTVLEERALNNVRMRKKGSKLTVQDFWLVCSTPLHLSLSSSTYPLTLKIENLIQLAEPLPIPRTRTDGRDIFPKDSIELDGRALPADKLTSGPRGQISLIVVAGAYC